jgi:hypothetical protein
MRTRPYATLALVLGLAATTLFAAPAGAVRITAGNGSGLAGQTVDIAISTTTLTGANVQSFQFDLTYNTNLVTATDVLETGTLVSAAGWGDATFNVTPGKISVSHAGTTALSGAGTLLTLRFLINPSQLTATSTTLAIPNFLFNEGAPLDTTVSGTLTINATPIITVSPNTGEVIRGQTLQFTASGTVTPPVTWSTTDNAIATINSSGLLTGIAPGSVRVTALDNAARTDQSDGDILIRGMGLTAGTASVVVGQPITLPLTVTSLTGLGIRAGQVTLTFNAALMTATGVTTPPGTLLNGYGTVGFGASSGTCTVDFAGSTDLSGAGVLCNITFSTQQAGGTGVSVPVALFNETMPAKVTAGSISVSSLPVVTVSPENVTLLAGATQQFTLGGTVSPPVTWSTLDGAVASISGTGLLTALSGGVTKVHAVDNVGATDENTSVTVYDFAASLPTISAPPGGTVRMPILVDRNLSGLGIRSLQYTLTFNSTHIVSATAKPQGLVGVWGPSGVYQNPGNGILTVAESGANAVGSGSNELQILEFALSPSVPVGTNLPITLGNFICNEGHPSAQITSGVIQVRTSTDVTPQSELSFALGSARPNPTSGSCRMRFTIPSEITGQSPVSLAVYGVDGRRLKTLVSGPMGAGAHEAVWNGRDESGADAPAGLYFVRLEWRGRELTTKLARIR